MDFKADHEEMDHLDENIEHNARLTRRVLFKTDTRTNVGNAKIIGMEKDLGLTNLQYSQGLAVFYATYVFSELPSNLVLKKVSPRIWLPTLTVVWGIITMCLGFVRNFASFAAVRALLGVAEGGLLPGMVLYLSSIYTRGELALRIGIFYTAASLSGAFGGLLARGLAAIGPRGDLEGWRWILIIEGLMTVAAGSIVFFTLPNNLTTARYFTPEEREWAVKRLEQDRGTTSMTSEIDEKFSWGEVRRGVFNVQVWLTSTAYFAILSGLYSFGLFLPTIVNDLHIASSPNQAQLWSVIPYAVATPVTVLVAFVSDRSKVRGLIILAVLPIAIIGYAVIANVQAANTRFAMTCLMALGMYASVPCILVWNSNNSAGHYKRATTSALQLAVANCGGFVASFVYPQKDGPLYHRGHRVILGLLCYAWVAVLLNVLWCAKINRDKKNGKHNQYIGYGDDRDPEFKLVM
ncbi:major facilitator superfamily domain-containing protein [Fusarium oxysporum Fo47]|uniref:major facilitator superfamily domain-containing protein n=1 Tax=Fusarium oxysporum Fo47 TaxID=660027 RepID=UPI002869E9FD|nr:major facilitator superfamily domain-containing protein [Fusarium oxysporum Fo47]QKD62783.2 major facilitator superfamily domain-containing protein [Fusarium oxysporum Fo47]